MLTSQPGKSSSTQPLNDGYEQLIKNNTPISQQAEAIERSATYAMDYSTGVPSISIPLYEIKVGDYTLPISISYHASGIRVQDMATPVGLGWVLNAGGVVNRQVRGTTDAITNNQLDLTYSSESEIDYDMLHNSVMTNHKWHRLAIKGKGDTESDRYSFSINGKSSVFRYCVTDNSLRTIPYSAVKIEHLSSDGFKITDVDGTKYYFEEGETAKFARHRAVYEAIHKGVAGLGLKTVIDPKIESGLVVSVLYPDDPNFTFEKIHDYCYERGFTIYPGKISTTNTFRLCALGTITPEDIENFFVVLKEAMIANDIQTPVQYKLVW